MSKDDQYYYDLVNSKPLKLNDKWYLIDKVWYESWCKNVKMNLANEELTKIQNSKLLSEGKIKAEVIYNLEYELIPQEVWVYLVGKYGIDCSDGELFQRNVISNHNRLIVEVEQLKLTISIYGKENKVTSDFSRVLTLNDIYDFIVERFAVTKPLRILQQMDNGTYDVVKLEGTVSLGDAGFSSSEHIFFDYQDSDGQWMYTKLKQKSSVDRTANLLVAGASCIASSSSGGGGGGGGLSGSGGGGLSGSGARSADGRVQGVCGLCNLGNTCFMNSAIQCISNVPPLTYYFLKTNWRADLNTTNPLGMHGRLAERYQQLLEQMWLRGSTYTVPRDFKVEVAKFAPQFSGYAQHDSQELMMFLLDGLHEDLNRIRKKPYQESSDADDDVEVAEKARAAWHYHQMRNDSVVVENFHGLLKSTVVCPDCSYVSVTFDAFGSLSLPLVQTHPQAFNIRFYAADRPLLKAKVLVAKTDTIKDFTDRIKLMFAMEKSFLTVTEIQNHRLSKVFMPRESISLLKDVDDLMIYDVPSRDDKEEWLQLSMRVLDGLPFGWPLMLSVPRTDLDWYGIKNRLCQRLPYLARIFGGQIVRSGTDLIDPKVVRTDFEKMSSVLSIFLHDKTAQELHLIDLDFHMKALQPQVRYELVLEWTKEGKDKFYDCSVEIPVAHESMALQHRPLNIESCVNEFIKTEKLGVNDLWYCKRCKDQKAATKKFDLWQLPKVLILHLKRFRSGSYRRDKIDTFVEFPLENLDLSNFVKDAHKDIRDGGAITPGNNDEIYDLVAVSNHMGGLGGGHYTAFAKNFINNSWYLFDDSHTSRITPAAVQTKMAYVLVYVSQSVLKHTRSLLNQDLHQPQEPHDEADDAMAMECG